MKTKLLLLNVAFIFLLFGSTEGMAKAMYMQETWTLTGKVLSSDNETLPGVSVALQGTNTATVTDLDGNFTLRVPAFPGELVFKYIGSRTQVVAFTGPQKFNIILENDMTQLGEVMVVGYGTQRRENLTGSVDQVKADAFINRPVTNLAQGLQGVLPNLNLTPSDGKPTRSPSFNIRGTTSIGQGGNALVLIDGVEGDPSLINPNDIETVSILKDAASASIYGARAAFGVVLITTKKPSADVVQVSYSNNFALKNPTTLPEFVTDSYQWATLFNEAFSSWNNYASTPQNVNKTLRFSQPYLQELQRRSLDPSLPKVEVDPATGEYVYYDNHNWLDDLYKTNTHSSDQNLSISGGGQKSKFFLSGRMLNQPGLFKYNSDDYKMYNFRARGTIQVAPWLSVDNNLNFSNVKYHTPLNVGEGGGIWRNIVAEGHPMAPMFNPDGTLTHSAAYTVGDYYYGKNGMDYDRNVFRNTTGFATNFLNNTFRIKGDFTYQRSANNESRIRVPVPFSRSPGVVDYVGLAYNDLREIYRNTDYIASNIYGEYEKSFNTKHNFKALAGFNYELSTYKRIGAERNGLIYDDATDMNLALGDAISSTGGYEQWNVMGGFFRVNYDFSGRYLLEVNGRYDGSSKFPSNERFAFFPSVSAGWRISAEPFWKVSEKLVSDFKVRASYGSLGNGNIDSYAFQQQMSVGRMTRILNGIQPSYTSAPGVLPAGLTWETATTANLGLDLSMFNNRLNINADAYVRKTTDMFTAGLQQPAVFGASSPRGNYADLETRGWELSVAWRNNFQMASKPFNYNLRVVVSDNDSKILKYNNPDKKLSDYYEGQRLGDMWGYVTEGFFQSDDDVRRSANQSLFVTTAQGVWREGDIKFMDVNNDGVINSGDNTLASHGDLVIVGNNRARYRYGVNLGADYRNVFISTFLQGVGKQDWYPSRGANTFWGQYNAPYGHTPVSQLGNIWSEENPDAYFPRYTGYIAFTAGGPLREVQTRYMQNVGYLRMKNLQVGYNIPKTLLSRLKVERASIYFSGENLFTYSPLHKITRDLDVENIGSSDQDLDNVNQGDGLNYPMLKSYSLGLSLTF